MSKQQTSVPARRGSKAPPRTGNRGGGNRRPPKRRPARSQGRFYGLLIALVVAVIVAVVVVLITSTGGSSHKPNANQPAANWVFNGHKAFGGLGPENVPLELGDQLASPNAGLTGAIVDGVQCNAGEQLAYHHHIHLSIFINGVPKSVPLGIGMVPPALVENVSKGQFAAGSGATTNACLYWLHVHATDGIVHIESPSVRTFLLGQVFGIWHQDLSPTQIGSYTGTVTAYVNGKLWTGDPTQVPLDEHTDIALSLGSPVAQPPLIDWNGTGL